MCLYAICQFFNWRKACLEIATISVTLRYLIRKLLCVVKLTLKKNICAEPQNTLSEKSYSEVHEKKGGI